MSSYSIEDLLNGVSEEDHAKQDAKKTALQIQKAEKWEAAKERAETFEDKLMIEPSRITWLRAQFFDNSAESKSGKPNYVLKVTYSTCRNPDQLRYNLKTCFFYMYDFGRDLHRPSRTLMGENDVWAEYKEVSSMIGTATKKTLKEMRNAGTNHFFPKTKFGFQYVTANRQGRKGFHTHQAAMLPCFKQDGTPYVELILTINNEQLQVPVEMRPTPQTPGRKKHAAVMYGFYDTIGVHAVSSAATLKQIMEIRHETDRTRHDQPTSSDMWPSDANAGTVDEVSFVSGDGAGESEGLRGKALSAGSGGDTMGADEFFARIAGFSQSNPMGADYSSQMAYEAMGADEDGDYDY